jgi:ribosomal protein S12 methylthiotransferase accessory factor
MAYPEMKPLAALFRSAADALIGATRPDAAVAGWLSQLGYQDEAPSQTAHRARMLQAAARLARVFTLDARDAPGLVAFGAEADPACLGLSGQMGGVAGKGVTIQAAFESCIGEAVEYLSTFLRPGDPVERLPAHAAIEPGTLTGLWNSLGPFLRLRDATAIDWTVVVDLSNGQPVRLPVDLCLRRPADERDIDVPWPLSIGCAAAPDAISATVGGLLELIERHAVTAWWHEGQPGRLFPLAAPAAGAAMVAQLRGDTAGRATWLIDITPADLKVPAVAAISCNPDGFGLCLGFSAGLTADDAARGAILELAQLELGYRLVETKLSVRGEASLNEADRRARRRFMELDVAGTLALRPMVPPNPVCDLPARDASDALLQLRDRLAANGLTPYVQDLTRPEFGVPVVRVVCPGLRIASALAFGDQASDGVPLF